MSAIKLVSLMLAVLFFSCSSREDRIQRIKDQTMKEKPGPQTYEEAVKDWRNNYGVGPVKSVELGPLDEAMVKTGFETFDLKCTACHDPYKEKIGPALVGILERRRPEWVMNMIMNPIEMAKTDPICLGLLAQYNSVMADQRLSEEQTRQILEYFRTLKLDDTTNQ